MNSPLIEIVYDDREHADQLLEELTLHRCTLNEEKTYSWELSNKQLAYRTENTS